MDNRSEPLAEGTDEQVRCATGEYPTDSNIEDETAEKQTKTNGQEVKIKGRNTISPLK